MQQHLLFIDQKSHNSTQQQLKIYQYMNNHQFWLTTPNHDNIPSVTTRYSNSQPHNHLSTQKAHQTISLLIPISNRTTPSNVPSSQFKASNTSQKHATFEQKGSILITTEEDQNKMTLQRKDSVEFQQFLQQSQPNKSTTKTRVDPKMASMILSKKYHAIQIEDNETIIFICFAILTLNQWFNYNNLISIETNFYKVIGIMIEWGVSLYFVRDAHVKIIEYRPEYMGKFHLSCLLNILSGPVQLIIDVVYYIKYEQLFWFSMLLRSLKMITTNYQKGILDDIYFSLNKSLPLIFTALVVYSVFTYVFTLFYCQWNRHYFKNIGSTALTLLQIITFDGWGDITRHLYHHSGITIIFAMWLFITIMAFYFWFLIYAFQIDVLILEESIKQNLYTMDESSIQLDSSSDQKQENAPIIFKTITSQLIKDLLVGKYYKRFIVIAWLAQLGYAHFQQNLSSIDDYNFIRVNMFIALTYTIHWLLLNTVDYQKQEQYHQLQTVFHTLAGPCALVFTFSNSIQLFSVLVELLVTQSVRFGPALMLFQIFTNESVRDISFLSLKILPYSVAPYITMLCLTFVLSVYMKSEDNHKINDLFQGFAYSLLTYFQVITLDDWDGRIARVFVKYNMTIPLILEVIFMLITNFLLIPAFVAFSCEIFQGILGVTFTPRIKTDNFEIQFFSHKMLTTEESENDTNLNHRYIEQQKQVIATLVKNKQGLFNYSKHPKLLKDLFKHLLRKEKQKQQRLRNLNEREQCLYYLLQQSFDKPITLTYKDQKVVIQKRQYGFIRCNVKTYIV